MKPEDRARLIPEAQAVLEREFERGRRLYLMNGQPTVNGGPVVVANLVEGKAERKAGE